jgi:hypothetical protein
MGGSGAGRSPPSGPRLRQHQTAARAGLFHGGGAAGRACFNLAKQRHIEHRYGNPFVAERRDDGKCS